MEPGPDDRSRGVSGSWKIVDDALHTFVGSEAPRRMKIVQCDEDVLKVRWD
jgi:hypothetical protein